MSRYAIASRLSESEAEAIGRRFVEIMARTDDYKAAPEVCVRELIELYDDAREWTGEHVLKSRPVTRIVPLRKAA